MTIQTLGLSPPEKRSIPLDNPSLSLSDPASYAWLSGGYENDAGEPMDEHLAMKLSTVWTCIRVLSESVASLPVRLLRTTPQGGVPDLLCRWMSWCSAAIEGPNFLAPSLALVVDLFRLRRTRLVSCHREMREEESHYFLPPGLDQLSSLLQIHEPNGCSNTLIGTPR
jgi:hypothetical protein